MRLFIGLKPSADFRAALYQLQEQLRETGIIGRYLEPRNLHMTLAFIGEWTELDSGILPVVKKPFEIRLSHPDVFPKAKVLWAGVEPSKDLAHLASQARKNLKEAGIPFDEKPFSPHITLVKKPIVPQRVILQKIPVFPAVMIINEVYLYRSERIGDEIEYTIIDSNRP